MTRFLSVFALAVGVFLVADSTSAQQPSNLFPVQPPRKGGGQPKAGGAPAEIPVVPKSSAAFLSLKVSDLVDHPDLKPLLEQFKKTPEAFEGVTELFGVTPHEIDRVTLFWPAISSRGPEEPIVVITTRDVFNEARVLKALRAMPVFDQPGNGRNGRHTFESVGPAIKVSDGPTQPRLPTKGAGLPTAPDTNPKSEPFPNPKPIEKQKEDSSDSASLISATIPGDPLFYELRSGGFELLFLVDEHTLVFLPGGSRGEFNVMALFAQLLQKKQTGPLAEAIATAGNHTLAGGIYLPQMFREFDRRLPPELAPFAALTAAKVGTITGDLGNTAKLTLTLSFEDAAAARRASPVLAEGFSSLADKMTAHLGELKEGRAAEQAIAPLFEAAAAGMKKATVKADGTNVIATGEIDAGPAAAKALADLMQALSSRKKFESRTNNLKQLVLAMHAYFDVNGRLPANIYGPNGELLLSWRVHLLPFIEQDNLYKQFKMDEAWDGPNNKKLIEQMPKVFDVTGRDAPKGQTFYQAFLTPDPNKPRPKDANPNQFFGRTWLVENDRRGQTLLVPDGTSNTIAIVEARTSVIWSKPDDLLFGEKLPPLGEERGERFMAAFLDGSVRALSTKLKPDVLRILIDSQDGMSTPDGVLDDERPRGFPSRGGRPGVAQNPAGTSDKPAAITDVEARRAVELERLEVTLAEAREQLAKAKTYVEAKATDFDRVTKQFQSGLARAQDVEKATAGLEDAIARLKAREKEVKSLTEQIAAIDGSTGGAGGSGSGPPPKK